MRAAAATLVSVEALSWPRVALVSYANAITLTLGLVQAIVTARALGPSGFGTVGVALGFGGVVTNLLDVRLPDIAGRLLFERSDPARDGGPAAVVRMAGLLQSGLAVASFAVTVLLMLAFLPRFTQQRLAVPALLALAAVPSLAMLVNYLSYMQRFADRIGAMALAQCLGSAAGTAVVVGIALRSPSVDAYATAVLLAALLGVMIHGVTVARLFPGDGRGWFSLAGVSRLLARRRLLFMTNALGYSKLLHRAADVLLVGFFCGDHQAGLYKCARSATDTLFAVNDVLAKTYQPRLFRLAAERNGLAFRRLGRRLLAGVLALALLAVLSELVVLPVAVPRVFGEVFADSVPSMMVLTVPVMWGFAVNLWAWPLLVTFTSLGAYTAISFGAVVAGQYGIGLLAYAAFGGGALPFAVGHGAVLVLLYAALVWFVRRRWPDFSPI